MTGNFLWKFCFQFRIRGVPINDLDHQIHVMVCSRDARNDVQTKVVDVGITAWQIDVGVFRFIFVAQFKLRDFPGVVSIKQDWRSEMIWQPLNNDFDILSDFKIGNADVIVSEELSQDRDFFRCKEPFSDSRLGQDRQSRNVAQNVCSLVRLRKRKDNVFKKK